ncbi:MAG: 50S ribosomal protein L3 [Candidatus Zambryskibacteria bacterium]|nr:50S ribosomal protein L3 [Candidatus Zambryskibacteria bacterium]
MKFILGTKTNMTQIFDEAGMVHPVTVLKAGPLTVTAVKTVSGKDGYNAVQVGFGSHAEKNITKPVKGQMKGGNYMYLREFRTSTEETPMYTVGDNIDLSTFSSGDKVTVSAISKGKGFQGVVKRHGFHGGPRSHGQKHSEREPGSIGGGGRDGGRVAKGKRMAGRMGEDRITSKGLTVVAVSPETGELFIRGAVPGRRGTLVEVKSEK